MLMDKHKNSESLPIKKIRRDMTAEKKDQICYLARVGGDRWFATDASYVLWRRGMLQSTADREKAE